MVAAWLVVLVLHGSGNGAYSKYYAQPSLAACEARLETMRYQIPSGGDAEQGFVAFCSESREDGEMKAEVEKSNRSFVKPWTW